MRFLYWKEEDHRPPLLFGLTDSYFKYLLLRMIGFKAHRCLAPDRYHVIWKCGEFGRLASSTDE